MRISTLNIILLFVSTSLHAGVYYLVDAGGNVTRHRGDTPYPQCAIWNVAINANIPENELKYEDGTIKRRSVQEMEAARQAAKNATLKGIENEFIVLCQQLGFEGKAGFDELEAVLKTLSDRDQARDITLKLLSIDAAGKRYDAKWWDDCAWHPEIAE